MPNEPKVPPESAEAQRRAYVVVGMHRSGTSAMTRTLSLLGAALPARTTAPREDNETGFWEPWPVALLNDEILEALDSEWDDVFAFRPKKYLSNFDRVYLGRAVELLDQEFNGSEVIVIKDPRISVLTSFWERALREAGYLTHYVVMVRNPLEVAESLRARDAFPREKSFLLWSSYMIAADRDTRDVARTFVSYDQLMNDWRAVRRRIEAGAGVPFPRDTAAAAIEIDRFLDRGMHHHSAAAKELFSRDDVPEHVKSLYRIFSEACDGGEIDAEGLKRIEAEMLELDFLVGPLLADLRGTTRALSSKVAELNEAHASARGHAQSLEEQIATERALREDEARAASLSSEAYEAQLKELADKIAAAETERDALMIDRDAQVRGAAELGAQLAAAEAERSRLQAVTKDQECSIANLADRLGQIEARRISLAEEIETKGRKMAELSRRVAHLEAELAAKDDKLSGQVQELEKLTELARKSAREADVARRDAEYARKSADAATEANEAKLAQRFQEIAKLTKLLKQHEQRAEQIEDHAGWLLGLNRHLAKQPRWWSLLPKRLAQRRSLKRLRDAGLFDGDAYLERYGDVAAAGADPLDHYLDYGYDEGRLRHL